MILQQKVVSRSVVCSPFYDTTKTEKYINGLIIYTLLKIKLVF